MREGGGRGAETVTRFGITAAALLFLGERPLRMLFGVDVALGVGGRVGDCLAAFVGDFDALRAFSVGFLIRVDCRSAMVVVTSDCEMQAMCIRTISGRATTKSRP